MGTKYTSISQDRFILTLLRNVFHGVDQQIIQTKLLNVDIRIAIQCGAEQNLADSADHTQRTVFLRSSIRTRTNRVTVAVHKRRRGSFVETTVEL